MFDILVYLFQHYMEFSARPEPGTLAKKLSAVGFEQGEIDEALTWLGGLNAEGELAEPADAPQGRIASQRIFTADEVQRLGAECLGFLLFLENSRIVSPAQREVILERATALAKGEEGMSLPEFKVIVLMVLWSQSVELDTLLIEALLADPEDEVLH
ncbi:Smg protein [Oryzomicrobium terrae]|uniref:Protein Smg homolog n=1 Tax=Oryzomicrobium terrae TaxID=1735038 RepID=A0A5C1E3L4_9RHOO|nr:DUF494 domain-containing protein [Oryzomicrobium terrae]QEL63492.1 Smg protein [Oryzomicrobium terrae]